MSVDEELFDITMRKETASLSHSISRFNRNKLFEYLNSMSNAQQWDYFVGCSKHRARPKK